MNFEKATPDLVREIVPHALGWIPVPTPNTLSYLVGQLDGSDLVGKAKSRGEAQGLLAVFDRFVRTPMYPSSNQDESAKLE